MSLFQQVQEREVELSSVREELSSALERVELLTSQFDETRIRADPANINAQLKLEEKDAELAGALARLGEYERVKI